MNMSWDAFVTYYKTLPPDQQRVINVQLSQEELTRLGVQPEPKAPEHKEEDILKSLGFVRRAKLDTPKRVAPRRRKNHAALVLLLAIIFLCVVFPLLTKIH